MTKSESTRRRRCTARRRDGKRCKAVPLKGQEVCRFHGGSSPQARQAAARRTLEAEAREAVRRVGFEPVDNPFTELQSLAGEMVAVKNLLRSEFERLDRLRYSSAVGTEQLRGELAAYQGALRDTAAVLSAIGRLRIDERMAAISEQQATVVIGAIEAALTAAGITGKDASTAKAVAARHLRGVS
jgi:hypothetical protein